MADTKMADTKLTDKSRQDAPTGTAARQLAERNRHPLMALRDEFDRLFDEASSMFRFPWGPRSSFGTEPLLRSAGAFPEPRIATSAGSDIAVPRLMPDLRTG